MVRSLGCHCGPTSERSWPSSISAAGYRRAPSRRLDHGRYNMRMRLRSRSLGLGLGLLAWAASTWALGRPAVLSFSPRDYDGAHQNWAVVQGKDGMIYAGNGGAGVLQYDGVSWRTIPVPNDTVLPRDA